MWRYIVAVDVTDRYALDRRQLYPLTDGGDAVVAVPWHARPHCVSSGAGCATLLPAHASIPLQTPGEVDEEHGYDMVLVAPVLSHGGSASGLAVLGELNKVTSVSSWRFRQVRRGAGACD